MELQLSSPCMPAQCRQGQLYLDQISRLSDARLKDFTLQTFGHGFSASTMESFSVENRDVLLIIH